MPQPARLIVSVLRDGQKRHVHFNAEESARSFYLRMTRTNGVAFVELVRLANGAEEILASHFPEPEGGAA